MCHLILGVEVSMAEQGECQQQGARDLQQWRQTLLFRVTGCIEKKLATSMIQPEMPQGKGSYLRTARNGMDGF